jgi:hypothetical protein
VEYGFELADCGSKCWCDVVEVGATKLEESKMERGVEDCDT